MSPAASSGFENNPARGGAAPPDRSPDGAPDGAAQSPSFRLQPLRRTKNSTSKDGNTLHAPLRPPQPQKIVESNGGETYELAEQTSMTPVEIAPASREEVVSFLDQVSGGRGEALWACADPAKRRAALGKSVSSLDLGRLPKMLRDGFELRRRSSPDQLKHLSDLKDQAISARKAEKALDAFLAGCRRIFSNPAQEIVDVFARDVVERARKFVGDGALGQERLIDELDQARLTFLLAGGGGLRNEDVGGVEVTGSQRLRQIGSDGVKSAPAARRARTEDEVAKQIAAKKARMGFKVSEAEEPAQEDERTAGAAGEQMEAQGAQNEHTLEEVLKEKEALARAGRMKVIRERAALLRRKFGRLKNMELPDDPEEVERLRALMLKESDLGKLDQQELLRRVKQDLVYDTADAAVRWIDQELGVAGGGAGAGKSTALVTTLQGAHQRADALQKAYSEQLLFYQTAEARLNEALEETARKVTEVEEKTGEKFDLTEAERVQIRFLTGEPGGRIIHINPESSISREALERHREKEAAERLSEHEKTRRERWNRNRPPQGGQ